MKYKELIQEYFDVSDTNDDREISFSIIKEVSPSIKSTSFYNNLDFLSKQNMDGYIGKSVGLFEGKIGFDMRDSLVNGMKIPSKFLMEKMIYDRSNKGIQIPRNIAEIIKNQVRSMRPHTLTKMYEGGNGYRLVFECDDESIYEITVRGR